MSVELIPVLWAVVAWLQRQAMTLWAVVMSTRIFGWLARLFSKNLAPTMLSLLLLGAIWRLLDMGISYLFSRAVLSKLGFFGNSATPSGAPSFFTIFGEKIVGGASVLNYWLNLEAWINCLSWCISFGLWAWMYDSLMRDVTARRNFRASPF